MLTGYGAGKRKVVLISGDVQYAAALRDVMNGYGYEVVLRSNAGEATAEMRDETIVGVLLAGNNLSERLAAEVRELRERYRTHPLLVSCKGAAEDWTVRLMRSGADACFQAVTPPAEIGAIWNLKIARVTAVSVRSCFDGIYQLLPSNHRFCRTNVEPARWVKLAELEYSIVDLLVSNVGRTVSHSALDSYTWGRDLRGDEVRRHRAIGRLRKGLTFLGGIDVFADHGRGYRLDLVP